MKRTGGTTGGGCEHGIEHNCNDCKPDGELVGQISGIDRSRITIYETENGVVFWHPWENREATNDELDDDFVQTVNRDITERGEWLNTDEEDR